MSDLPSSSHTPGHLMREFVRLYLIRQRRFAHDQGIPPQGRLLGMLLRNGPLTQGELGRIAGLDKSWISRGIDRMVEEGWVERVPLASDRRCMELHLTDKGRELAQVTNGQLDEHAEALFEHIPEERHAPIAQALQTLIDALAQLDQPTKREGV
ncbi:MarR family winged helix-turn-helix transcriptional regulator [Uliginosibacterium gangwonense]|uniref:MarR family winged helix-turn-helix transcriptional regulator n=1 Tax=Uliginosibacterium gangwonense TaxID=392736 RepID=UPI0003607860|nr:MarR family winged helix-turn-helix transcriptional regulator [Uliginosibacterium gangwonense]